MIKYPDTCAATALSEEQLKREAARALRRMCETGTILVVASSMEKAAILRERAGKEPTRVGVLDKLVAEAMALKGWIQCGKSGRVTRYVISRAGREALTHLLSDMEEPPQLPGFSEAASVFEGAEREVEPTLQSRRRRYGVAETPLTGLARRKDRDGKPFLPDDLIRAGERLREDFELAQMEPRSGQNWDMFLTAGVQAGQPSSGLPGPGSAARHRVTEALRDLGPGLGDVVLRCCCFLEGLERIEKRMGWSARSGKIVLRIALQRLKRHYDSLGDAGNLIG